MATILFVDDDPDFTSAVQSLLQREGYSVRVASSCAEAREALEHSRIDLMFVDLLLPDGNGLELVSETGPGTVIITGHPSIESAIRAVRGPVIDYIVKPVDWTQLLRIVRRALESDARSSDGERTHGKPAAGVADAIIGDSAPMQKLRERINEFGPTDITVLITGESGTGKELVAEALHRARSPDSPFVALNCGAIPQDLLASELFGHEKGSFTGAAARRQGLFERAGDGTVFLDEISELPLQQQVALLRVLETMTVQRVGAEKEVAVSSRIVAATNRPLEQRVADGSFREDLYFRINVLSIAVPPLRDRGGDVAALALHFLNQFATQYDTPSEISDACLEQLEAYEWPGNVRELKHTVLRAAMLNRGESRIGQLPDEFQRPPEWMRQTDNLEPGMSIREVEQRLIEKTLEHFEHNRRRTADALGISLKTLYNRLRDYGREPEEEG